MVAMDIFCDSFGGGKIPQNVIASRAGITKNNNKVYCGGMPSVISDAYDSDPIMPAPPVPDDHALITRLLTQNLVQLKINSPSRLTLHLRK